MILRKPYAFLIKHFKMIHLVITLLFIFVIGKTNNIVNFFKDYVNNDVLKIDASKYVNGVYLSLFLIVLLSFIIIILLKKKEKPLLFYFITIGLSFVLMIGFYYEGSIITELEFGLLDRKTINMARDIVRFMIIIEGIMLIPYIIRTLGFDIKKFDFKKDLQDLNITLEDNEEFEVLSPLDVNKINRKGRRSIRELKYYYIENKLMYIVTENKRISEYYLYDFKSGEKIDKNDTPRFKEVEREEKCDE